MHNNDNGVIVCIHLLTIHEARYKKKELKKSNIQRLIKKINKLLALVVFGCFCVKF